MFFLKHHCAAEHKVKGRTEASYEHRNEVPQTVSVSEFAISPNHEPDDLAITFLL
jgi:hypothetical protein